jgi:hypothetical protein
VYIREVLLFLLVHASFVLPAKLHVLPIAGWLSVAGVALFAA